MNMDDYRYLYDAKYKLTTVQLEAFIRDWVSHLDERRVREFENKKSIKE